MYKCYICVFNHYNVPKQKMWWTELNWGQRFGSANLQLAFFQASISRTLVITA